MFYRAVAQAVIIFGSEIWVILAGMEKKVGVTHIGFLEQIKEKRERHKADGIWEIPRAEVLREAARTQSEIIYRDGGTVGGNAADFRGVRRREGLCGGGAGGKHGGVRGGRIPLMSTLDEISREAKMRRQGERDTQ